MKLLDKLILIIIIAISLFFISKVNNALIYIFKFLITLIVILILFYEKTFSVKDKLSSFLCNFLNYCHLIINPFYLFINNLIKPIKIGLNISISTAPFIIISILLTILIIL